MNVSNDTTNTRSRRISESISTPHVGVRTAAKPTSMSITISILVLGLLVTAALAYIAFSGTDLPWSTQTVSLPITVKENFYLTLGDGQIFVKRMEFIDNPGANIEILIAGGIGSEEAAPLP